VLAYLTFSIGHYLFNTFAYHQLCKISCNEHIVLFMNQPFIAAVGLPRATVITMTITTTHCCAATGAPWYCAGSDSCHSFSHQHGCWSDAHGPMLSLYPSSAKDDVLGNEVACHTEHPFSPQSSGKGSFTPDKMHYSATDHHTQRSVHHAVVQHCTTTRRCEWNLRKCREVQHVKQLAGNQLSQSAAS